MSTRIKFSITMKPYKIPAPRIWVTDQAPIIYGGKLFYIKPSYVLGDKSKTLLQRI